LSNVPIYFVNHSNIYQECLGMRVILPTCFTMAGLIVSAVPALTAQTLPYNLQQPRPASVSNSASAASKGAGPEAKAFKGQYAVAIRGAAVGGTSPSRELTAVGSIIADGDGHIRGVVDFNSANVTAHAPITGSYTLNADGTGTLTWIVSPTDVGI
jgi:hypothetical protein